VKAAWEKHEDAQRPDHLRDYLRLAAQALADTVSFSSEF
jgi:hypothetical protein